MVNPIAQIPTLVLDDGSVLTESAAITLHLVDLTSRDDLVPGPLSPERAAFLRWLIFLMANTYPTFTYADDPARFVDTEGARDEFRLSVDAYAARLYGHAEAVANAPWFLGERFAALDISLAVMTQWLPRRAWFAANTPKLYAIPQAADNQDALVRCFERNFPTDE